MNNLPRKKLSKFIATYGHDLCNDPRRVKALLTDVCGMYKREINILIATQNEKIPAHLMVQKAVAKEA